MRLFATETSKYTLYGAVFGALFPIVASTLQCLELTDGFSISGLIEVQQTNHLLWIIDTAPFVLGLFARFGGSRQDQIRLYAETLEAKVAGRTSELSVSNNQLREEILAHQESESALQKAREELEMRVADRTRELEAKNRELEEIVYVASHDLRSPLVNIQGHSKELEFSVQELSDILRCEEISAEMLQLLTPIVGRDIPESLSYVHANVSKMDGLLAGLLRLSRLGREAPSLREVDMNNILTGIRKSLECRIARDGICLQIDDLPSCRGDAAMLDQVFCNLIDNAIKYRDPQRSCLIRVSGFRSEGAVAYIVEDNGLGIPQEQREKVFEIFHRLNPSDGLGGEGLGLAIVGKVLDMLGGSIELDPENGCGSRFIVTLPMVKDELRSSSTSVMCR